MSIRSLFLLFLRLGATSFGGYMVLVAAVQAEVIEKRKLMSAQDFAQGFALCQVLPGALSVNMIAYVGHRLAGKKGALTAMVAVLLPATLLTLLLAVVYFRFHNLPITGGFFKGIGPVVAVLILVAGWRLGSKIVTGVLPLVLAALTFVYVGIFKGSIIVPLIVSGLAGLIFFRREQ